MSKYPQFNVEEDQASPLKKILGDISPPTNSKQRAHSERKGDKRPHSSKGNFFLKRKVVGLQGKATLQFAEMLSSLPNQADVCTRCSPIVTDYKETMRHRLLSCERTVIQCPLDCGVTMKRFELWKHLAGSCRRNNSH